MKLPFEDVAGWKDTFVEPTQRRSDCIFAARILLAAGWLYCTIWYFVITKHKEFWVIHLTTWGALVETVYLILSAFATYKALYSKSDGSGAAVPWFATTTWVLGAVVPAVTAAICVMFWALDYKPGNPIKLSTVATHGWNMLFAIVDVAISRRPFGLSHVYMPMAFGLCYGVFTLVYYMLGGTHRDGVHRYIYAALDWGKPRQTFFIIAMVVFVALPLFHVSFVAIMRCVQCGRRCCAGSSAKDQSGSAASDQDAEAPGTAVEDASVAHAEAPVIAEA